jgi:hypothetical protein
VLSHKFFSTIDFAMLKAKQLEPPFTPEVEDDEVRSPPQLEAGHHFLAFEATTFVPLLLFLSCPALLDSSPVFCFG